MGDESTLAMLGAAAALQAGREHGPQAGGNLHQVATRDRAGFMSARHVRALELLTRSSQTSERVRDYYNFQIPPENPSADNDEMTGGVDGFLSRWQRVLWDPSTDEVKRGELFDVPSGYWRVDGTRRPGWILLQPPANGITGYITRPLSVPNPDEGFVVLGISQDHTDDPAAGIITAFGWCQSSDVSPIAPIDGDNIVYVQYTRNLAGQYELYFAHLTGGVGTQIGPVIADVPIKYLGIYKRDVTWQGWVSSDGDTWRMIGELNSLVQPDRVTLGLASVAPHSEILGLKLFRSYPDATV